MLEQTSTGSPLARKGNHKLIYEPSPVQPPSIWHPLLNEPLLARARAAAFFVAERMRDADYVHRTEEQARQQSSRLLVWSPFSLYGGDVGVAFMYGYIDQLFPGRGYDALAQYYLSFAAASTQQSTFQSPSLSGGTSGLALALSLISQGGKRYQKTLIRLHQGLCEQVLQRSWPRPEAQRGVAVNDYDVILGAAGVLAYLVSLKHPDEPVLAAIERLLDYLLWLAEPDQPMGRERWYIPPELLSQIIIARFLQKVASIVGWPMAFRGRWPRLP